MEHNPSFSTIWHEKKAIALLLAASLTVMANATISPALAGLEAAFAATPDVGLLTRLLVPAPSLSVMVCAPLAGLLADRFGRRWMLLLGIILFVISGSAGLYLPSLLAIFVSRLVLGVAVAMIMTAGTALVGDYFVGEQRSNFAGLEVSARNFGGFLFIVLAGYLAAISPRLPFAIYGLPVLFLPFMWTAIREPNRLTQATRSRTAIPSSISAKRAGAEVQPTWIGLVLALALLQMVTNMLFFVMPTQLPFFFAALGENSAVCTGSALGALTLSGGCAALASAPMRRGIGFLGNYSLGYALMALGFMLVSAATPRIILVGAAAIGAGYALVAPSFVIIALKRVPELRRGLVAGVLTTSIFLGQILSPLLSTPSIAAFGYAQTFASIALLLAVVAGVAIGAKLLHHRARN